MVVVNQFQIAIDKIKEFVTGMEQDGWKLKGYRFSLIKGVAKIGVDIQNSKGEVLQYNQQI